DHPLRRVDRAAAALGAGARMRARDARGEAFVAGAFVASIVGALGLAVVYVAGGQTQLEGIFLFLALGGIGVGLVGWGKRFMPNRGGTGGGGRRGGGRLPRLLPGGGAGARAAQPAREAGGGCLRGARAGPALPRPVARAP